MFNQSGCVEMHIHFFFWHGLHGLTQFFANVNTNLSVTSVERSEKIRVIRAA